MYLKNIIGGGGVKKESFTKKERVKKEKEIINILKNGQRIKSNCYTVCFKENELSFSRLGVSVSKKVGNSVTRNYCKRVVREVFRKSKPYIKKGYDFFVIVKNVPENTKVLFNELEKIFQVFYI